MEFHKMKVIEKNGVITIYVQPIVTPKYINVNLCWPHSPKNNIIPNSPTELNK